MNAKVAIVGSGPSGCYVAQALVKALPNAELTVIDRLCVPFGLIRYGVAPDHQGTKAVSRQFARLFEKQGVAFVGNVELGRDLSLEALRDAMDVVVLATGLYGDRTFEVPGKDLSGIYGSGAVTRYWNGHPDSEGMKPEFGKRVVILGNGNVAIDVLRLLAKSPVEFDGSDIEPEFVDDGVETIHIVGRSPLEKAKFDAVMIKELGGLESANAMIADGDSLVPDSDDQKVSALRTLFGTHKDGAKKTVIFHSGWTVTAFGGDNGKVMSVSLENHKEERRVIDCDSVVSAIGFEDAGTLVENKTLPVPDENGALGGGLFAAGWFKRGPKGTIPENRTDSQSVANSIVAYLDGVSIWQKPGRMALMPSIQDKATTYEHWLAIDERERASAPPGRVRSKIRNRRDMFAIIKEQRVTG